MVPFKMAQKFACFVPILQFLSEKVPFQSFRKFAYNSVLCSGRRFTDKHEWVSLDSAQIATVGITQHAQEALGDVVYIQLPEVGTQLRQNEECGVLESVKAASEIYSPITGEVTQKNTDLEKEPGLINRSCYDKGWLIKAKVDAIALPEIDQLMDEDQYNAFLKTNA